MNTARLETLGTDTLFRWNTTHICSIVRSGSIGAKLPEPFAIEKQEDSMPSIDLVTTADRFIAAFSAGDWQHFTAFLAPDVRYSETGTGRQVVGAEPYLQLCQGWKQVFPDARGTISATVTEGSTVVQELVWEGTQAGPLPTPGGEISASGRRIAVAATLWYTFDQAKMTTIRHHIDLFTMLQQLGAFEPASPPAGQ